MNALSGIEFTEEERDILDILCATSPELSETARQELKRRHAARLAIKRTQRYRKKQQDEMIYLKYKVVDLQAQYDKLVRADESDNSSPKAHWKAVMRRERQRWQDSMKENAKLKEFLKEYAAYTQLLVDIMQNKPRLSRPIDLVNDQWQILKLVANPNVRRAAFHAIVDREYEKRESIHIQFGVIDEESDFERIEPSFCDNGDVEIAAASCNRFIAPFQAIVDAAWDIMRGAVVVPQFDGQYTMIHEIDESIAYIGALYSHSGGQSQSRLIVKRYFTSPKCCVIVSKSIVEDEALPLDTRFPTCSESTWLTIEMVNNDEVIVRFCEKTREVGVKYDLSLVPHMINDYRQGMMVFDDAVEARTLEYLN